MSAGEAWADDEVEAIIADYLHMLMLELSGQKYSKSEHRRRLQPSYISDQKVRSNLNIRILVQRS